MRDDISQIYLELQIGISVGINTPRNTIVQQGQLLKKIEVDVKTETQTVEWEFVLNGLHHV